MEKVMKSVAIVGAGVLGLAHAYAYAKRGYQVRVFERSPRATGASIRNFGMLWPIGQPSGKMTEIAMLSRAIWLEVLEDSGLPFFPEGSLHLVYRDDEQAVALEFAQAEPKRASWITPEEVMARSGAARPDGLRGALYSPHEVIVDPALTIRSLPEYLTRKFGVEFHFATAVQHVDELGAEQVLICAGDDFETLYPEHFRDSGLTRVKLQMMRTAPQPTDWRMGPALAAGLTLQFYSSFEACPSLPLLKERIAREMPEYNRWGIHVMASTNANGAVTIGDSHEYGLDVNIFNRDEIDDLILRYLDSFAVFPNRKIEQRWYGVYAKHPGMPFFTLAPEAGVRIVTGTSGSGMTLSFGLAETLTAS
jgi:FAD dependent oxidoreductase TIGR03364